jgi:hypothetical protein
LLNFHKKEKFILRLTVRKLIICCVNGVADALVDAAIVSGLPFFSTLGGGYVAGLETVAGLKAAAAAVCAQFFIFLVLNSSIVQLREALASTYLFVECYLFLNCYLIRRINSVF